MSGKDKDKKGADKDKKATIAEGLQQVEKIVSALLVRQDSTPFREPVDWRQMNLLDYPEKVKKPMDLGTVKKLLAAGAYSTLAECADDVRRVWSNCRAYNPEGSDLHELSVTLSKRFEVRLHS
jgi:Bromodomain